MPPPPESTDPWVTARVRGVIGPGVLLGSSVGTVAVAVWLVPASLHIVDWDADRPRLVALLAPWRALGLAAAGSVVGMLAVAAADLRIENNHQQQDYAAFYPDELRPDFLRRGRDDVIYSIHAPGLPFLLVPGFALAGYRGAVATMALFASLAALALFDLVRRFAGLTALLIGWVLGLPAVWARFPPSAAVEDVQEIRVVPTHVVPRRDRIDRGDGVRRVWTIDATAGAHVLFVDDNTVPRADHFWVRRRATGTILVVAPADRIPHLTVTNMAPVRDTVRVQSGGWTAELELDPGETQRVRVSRADRAIVPITLTTTAAFAPEPTDRTGQWVDCHVRIDLRPAS